MVDEPSALKPADEPLIVEPGSDSIGSLTIVGGSGLTLWSHPETRATPETRTFPVSETRVKLALQPDRPAIIGRSNGYPVPYLNPAYVASNLLPGTQQSILSGEVADRCVSRAHFMLRANPAGIVLINGVPHIGGGLRSPMNGTRLVEPEHRSLAPEEELLIARGTFVVLELPNYNVIRVEAE